MAAKALVEVVCCSVEDCIAAEQAGAGRIELCSAISAGGITPSLGMFEACRKAVSIPIMVMIRPREGGFYYSESEFEQMQTDVSKFKAIGAYGVVFGILNSDGSLDTNRMQALRTLSDGMQTMCHRAFDVVPNPLEALEQLDAMGFNRVLSSGQERDIRQGMPLLKQLMTKAKELKIEVQPCEHIRKDNVQEVLQELSPKSVHLGPFLNAQDPTSNLNRPVTYGSHKVLDGEAVREVALACQ
jgi:copper homeostasis protein